MLSTLVKLARFTEAWVTLTWVDFRLSATPYSTWNNHYLSRLGEATEGRGTDNKPEYSQVRRVIGSCEAAKRYHWRHMNCLRRCFAQQKMLQRRNIPCQLHLGVKKYQGKLMAHAWLSYKGKILNDSAAVVECYVELQLANWGQLAQSLAQG